MFTPAWARAALSHRVFTGLSRQHLADLIVELAAPWTAAHQAALDHRRGHARQRAAGAGPRHGLAFADRVLVTLVILRFQLPHQALAVVYGVDRATITRAIGEGAVAGRTGRPVGRQDRPPFANYRFDIVVLSLATEDEQLDWTWINRRRDAGASTADCLKLAPQAWWDWVKGGADFVGRLDVGDGFARAPLVVLGQAKCEQGATSGLHLARLRRGWLGVFVTTGHFSLPAQREVLDDQYPLVLIHGLRLAAEVLRLAFERHGSDVGALLETVDATYEDRLQIRGPEEILWD